jgi:hypothetical protein
MEEKLPAPRPSLEELRKLTKQVFGQIPCLWQLRVVDAILQRNKDVILTAATGAGKTLTFWMPLLARPEGVQIICAPLNILGTLNVRALAKHGIRAITVTAENALPATFRVRKVVDHTFCVDQPLSHWPGHWQLSLSRRSDKHRNLDEDQWMGICRSLAKSSVHEQIDQYYL